MTTLIINIKSFLFLYLAYSLHNVIFDIEAFQNILFFTKDFNPTVGSLLYLPIGAALLSYLLYGKKAILGIFAAIILSGIYNELKNYILAGYTIVGSLGPLLAIYLIEKFRLANFKDFPNTSIRHLVLLCIFAGLINTVGNFIVYFSYPFSDAAISWFNGGPTQFLLTFLPGDIVGGSVFLLTSLAVIKFFHLDKTNT